MAIAIYARKSVERENSISFETQIEYCKRMIKPEEQNEKVHIFVDNGYSGSTIDRADFQKMMKMVRQNKIDKIIVYKLDRFTRSISDLVAVFDELKEHNVKFVSSQEAIDTSSIYGDAITKIMVVFAELERATTIERVTQAYAHRSDMGFYMGGRRPYGFETVPTVLNNTPTKRFEPIVAEIKQIQYIYEVYAQESVSLRRLQNLLVAEGKNPLDGSSWTTAKLSSILKNPIYVKADSDVYDYYEHRGVRIVSAPELFTGEYGAQLYGKTKHQANSSDWSDMKLVCLTHKGVVNSDIWLKCQKKLEKNRQITNSYSSKTSWLAGKVVCEKCGHTMTIVKGKINKGGEVRRYFNCTGKSHKKTCAGVKVTIYAEDLENMVYDCITEKLAELKNVKRKNKKDETPEMNNLKLQIKDIETKEKQLLDTILAGGFNEDLLVLVNQKASQLKHDKMLLQERLEDMKSRSEEKETAIDLAKSWKKADYQHKKEVAMLMIHKIIISEDGSTKIIWNV